MNSKNENFIPLRVKELEEDREQIRLFLEKLYAAKVDYKFEIIGGNNGK